MKTVCGGYGTSEQYDPQLAATTLEYVFNWKKTGIRNGSRERNEVKRPEFFA